MKSSNGHVTDFRYIKQMNNSTESQINVSVIIVNYNSTDLLIDAVKSIIVQTHNISYEIIVVDNASPDHGTIKLKNELQDRIHLIVSERNLGFGGANNLGIAEAKGKYIFFLNPDTLLLNDAIAIFKKYMEEKENSIAIGAIGCILSDEDKRPTNSYHFFLTPLNIIGSTLKLQRPLYMVNIAEPLEVDFITGAALFVPRKVLNDVGGFDEQFFMYCEEVDLEKRMADKGYKRIIIPGPCILHYDGGSFVQTKKRSARRRLEYDRSRLFYIRKHFRFGTYLCFKMVFLLCRIPAYFNYHYTFSDNLQYLKMLLK